MYSRRGYWRNLLIPATGASHSQALMVLGDFIHSDIWWESSTESCRQPRKLLELSVDIFCSQVIDSSIRWGYKTGPDGEQCKWSGWWHQDWRQRRLQWPCPGGIHSPEGYESVQMDKACSKFSTTRKAERKQRGLEAAWMIKWEMLLAFVFSCHFSTRKSQVMLALFLSELGPICPWTDQPTHWQFADLLGHPMCCNLNQTPLSYLSH